MKVEKWEVGRPIPYDRNPRIISAEAVEQVANSLSEVGWQQPIVVNKDGVIIVGHTRLQAAKRLEMETVPVVVFTGTKEEEDRYRLRDNKSGEFSKWDFEILGIDWEAPELEELGFDLGDVGIMEGDVEDADFPDLGDGSDSEIQNKNFTLANHQAEIVDQALKKAGEVLDCDDVINENSNGNRLFAICRAFLDGN